ncbi:MAG: class I SAM-dependent methyltransferase [Thermofilaceae archaeon]
MIQNIWELKGYAIYRQIRRAQAVMNTLKFHNPKIILDVGCAEGFITSLLVSRQAFVVGIDVNEEALKIAKVKVKDAEFICASIALLPFRDRCFEAITLLEVLEHLPDSILREGIKEVDRVLNYGGVLVVSVPYREKIIYTQCIHCGKLTPLWGHLRSMDERDVTDLLPRNYNLTLKYTLPNLELISLSSLFNKLPFKLWLVLNNILGRVHKGYWLLLKYRKGTV